MLLNHKWKMCVYGGYACIATSKVYKALQVCSNHFMLLKKQWTNSTVVWLPGVTDVWLWRSSESFWVAGWDVTRSHKVYGEGCKSTASKHSSGPPSISLSLPDVSLSPTRPQHYPRFGAISAKSGEKLWGHLNRRPHSIERRPQRVSLETWLSCEFNSK